MSGVNKVILVGHLGGDPDVHRKDGRAIAFSLATSESWRDKATDWRPPRAHGMAPGGDLQRDSRFVEVAE